MKFFFGVQGEQDFAGIFLILGCILSAMEREIFLLLSELRDYTTCVFGVLFASDIFVENLMTFLFLLGREAGLFECGYDGEF